MNFVTANVINSVVFIPLVLCSWLPFLYFHFPSHITKRPQLPVALCCRAHTHTHIWLRNAYSLHSSLSLDKCRSFTRWISASMRAHHKLFTWINEGNKYLFSLNEIYWSVSFVGSFFLAHSFAPCAFLIYLSLCLCLCLAPTLSISL